MKPVCGSADIFSMTYRSAKRTPGRALCGGSSI